MTLLLNGFELAKTRRAELAERVRKLPRSPKLAVILVGNDPASAVYVKNKEKAAAEAGIESVAYRLENITQTELLALIAELNADKGVDGILIQLPLPDGLNEREILQAVDPAKDVDGFHPLNLGKLMIGEPAPVACTPKGCMELIHLAKRDLTGLREDCTVTTAHSKTRDLPDLCRTADILVAAVGKPKIVKPDWIKNGAIVIDVGINRLPDGKLCGDVDFEACFDKCAAITPVPKGVGPMTIAMLMENTVEAYQRKL